MCHKKTKNTTSSLLPELRSRIVPANFYLFKVNNRNTEKKVLNMSKVNSKDTRMKSGAFMLTLKIFHTSFRFSIVNF